MEHHPDALKNTDQIEIQETPYQTLLEIGKKRGYLLRGEIDENRLMRSFIKDIRENKLGAITWERADDQRTTRD